MTTYSPRRMAGPCANGFERNGGVRWHALPAGSFRALCGARSKSFWSDEVGKAVTCPRCLKRLAKLEPPPPSPFYAEPPSSGAPILGERRQEAATIRFSPPADPPRCEKCGKPISGTVYQWERWEQLCWPCKKPMMDAALPKALAALKAEFESPAVSEAIGRMLFDDPKERS